MSRQRLSYHLNPTVVLVALAVTAIAAVTKAHARSGLAEHDIHVVGSLWLRLQYNSGISFSFNRSGPFVTTALTALVALAVALVGLNARPGIAASGFGLLLGGGIANVIDRFAAVPHRVTDFIALGSFPVFNLADVAITVGFVILVVEVLRGERIVGQ